MFRNLAFSIAVVGLVAATVAPARSAVITVSGGCTLVDAVSAANADAIVGGCAAGSGADTVVLEHDVTLTAVEEVWMELFGNFNFGASGLPVVRTAITIEGGGYAIARHATAPQFRIFSVAGGSYGAGDLTLRNVTVSNGYLDGGGLPFFTTNVGERAAGGAILSLSGHVAIEDSVLSNNSADNGGVLAIGGGAYEVFNSEFLNNDATLLGGAVIAIATTAGVQRSRFADNEALSAGGAIANVFDAPSQIADSSFLRNTAMAGGAIYNSSFTSEMTVVNGLFQDNVVRIPASHSFFRFGGGAVDNFNAASATIRNSLVTANGAADGFYFGAGVRSDGSGAVLTLIDSVVRGNGLGGSAPWAGGGVYLKNSYLDARGSVIEGNTARNQGGGVYSEISRDTIISASTIDANTAITGGGVFGRDSEITVQTSRIINNLASRDGGGVYVEGFDDTYQLLTIADSTVSGNGDLDGAPGNVTGAGVMVDGYSDALINRSTIAANVGGGSTGIASAGAAIFANSVVQVDVINSTLAGNDASPFGGGGAIFSSNGSNVDVAFSTIVGNTAYIGGGVRNISGMSLEGAILADNIATNDAFENCSDFMPPTDSGANLADDASCGGGIAVVSDAELALGALGANGGATETIKPGATSVAIDYSGAACAITGGVDQRGAARDTACDSGAVEAGWTLPLIAFETAGLEVIEGLDTGFDVAIVLDNSAGDLDAGEVEIWPILNGSAAYDWDYALPGDAPPLVVDVPAPGAATTTLLSFVLNDDDEVEGPEDIVISFVFSGPASLGGQSGHLVSILDDDSIGPGACAVLQAEMQTLMGDEDPEVYRNHGRYVSPVARITDLALRNAEITQECQGCIVNQFARSVPIAEQSVCGGSSTLIAVRG
jgi:hypothetical protein